MVYIYIYTFGEKESNKLYHFIYKYVYIYFSHLFVVYFLFFYCHFARGITVNFRSLRIGTLKRYARFYNIPVTEDMSAHDYASLIAKYGFVFPDYKTYQFLLTFVIFM